jgi:hypothetical protein
MKITSFSIASVLITLALTATGQVDAAVVTFGDSALGYGSWNYSEAGFLVTGTGANSIFDITTSRRCVPNCVDNGTPFAMVDGSPGSPSMADTLVVKSANNHLFNLTSFDGAETYYLRYQGLWATSIRVTGVLADNSLVTKSFVLDWINDGPDGKPDFQTFQTGFAGGFKEIRFTGMNLAGTAAMDFSIDNLNLTDAQAPAPAPAPEPGSNTLLGLGLLGLCVFRRKLA